VSQFGHGIEAFTWISSSSSHVQKVATVLKKLGAKIPAGTTLTTAVTISADGSTMAGQYVNGQTFGNWIAHITK
jgi:hypothetical protein